MNQHNFTLVNMDTDSISICKPDMVTFTSQERKFLLDEINSLLPEMIKMDDDGFYHTVIVIKAKNYILYDGDKIKIKGSALKASGKGTAEKEIIKKFIDCFLFIEDDTQRTTKLQEIYMEYVEEALFIDSSEKMLRWASRKTITDKIFNSERENEAKVRRAIEGTEYVEGDRIRVFFKGDDSLCLIEKFDGDYERRRLLEKLYKTILVFDTIISCKTLFKNYSLKKNRIEIQDKYNIVY